MGQCASAYWNDSILRSSGIVTGNSEYFMSKDTKFKWTYTINVMWRNTKMQKLPQESCMPLDGPAPPSVNILSLAYFDMLCTYRNSNWLCDHSVEVRELPDREIFELWHGAKPTLIALWGTWVVTGVLLFQTQAFQHQHRFYQKTRSASSMTQISSPSVFCVPNLHLYLLGSGDNDTVHLGIMEHGKL